MLRILFVILLVLGCSLLFLNGRMQQVNSEKPIFLKTDNLAEKHTTTIDIKVTSLIKPTEQDLLPFKKDYANIWAHLNNLYETNNVTDGKEYYTEDWFKQICMYYKHQPSIKAKRSDVSHKLVIKNWAWDGLVCTVVDTVQMNYKFNNKDTFLTENPLSIVLLYQGDHWRIDALSAENYK
jgi:hypothetical protein